VAIQLFAALHDWITHCR